MHCIVVRTSFRMMMILVDHVGAEVANQSKPGLQHSSTLGAWPHGYVGPA